MLLCTHLFPIRYLFIGQFCRRSLINKLRLCCDKCINNLIIQGINSSNMISLTTHSIITEQQGVIQIYTRQSLRSKRQVGCPFIIWQLRPVRLTNRTSLLASYRCTLEYIMRYIINNAQGEMVWSNKRVVDPHIVNVGMNGTRTDNVI